VWLALVSECCLQQMPFSRPMYQRGCKILRHIRDRPKMDKRGGAFGLLFTILVGLYDVMVKMFGSYHWKILYLDFSIFLICGNILLSMYFLLFTVKYLSLAQKNLDYPNKIFIVLL